MSEKKVIVVGGGITGLATVYYLQKEAKEKALPIKIKLIEASDRLGGVISTAKRDGFIIERGPDSIIARKKSALRLIEEVGLQDKIISNTAGKSYIYARGKLHTMPEGSFMGIPTKVTPFALSGLFSPLGKLRAAADFILPKGEPAADQSLGAFFRRRLGNEIVDNMIDPLLSGIYAGDIDELSLMALFPNFYEIEQKHRSLVIGLNKSMPKPQKTVKKAPSKKGMFISLSTGLEELVHQVENRLEAGTVLKGTAVEKVEKTVNGYQIKLSTGAIEEADSVVIATEHFHAKKMLSDYSFMEPFEHMPSNSVANVAMAFPKSAIEKDIDGTGFLVSRNSDFRITACTWTHKKWPGTSPEDMALLRCYVGKPDDQEAVDLSDEEIVDLVLKDLNKTMNITAKPKFHIVTRWRKSMPQYTVGHLEKMAKVKQQLDEELPGVYLAGGSFEGVGIPGCIDQAEAAVKKVIKYLS
ncbi:protoporphyrinogen oxidase [Mesobacillus subterraneus]|uniref:protoporphyrinogen oxidase n=1 Tax=Mesobacillus subterraneus TaxID=285983 RepID=UPI00203F073B|nr:protoporphyrinogen oxidase [Mesobacillus subterraneus]MCM3666344.1 protoporphyrinogen oxidase [Mesobacillus subterraneus]MCM3685384.1 protoporphyrinogen oxidase [Mesobacillus subterraneus]